MQIHASDLCKKSKVPLIYHSAFLSLFLPLLFSFLFFSEMPAPELRHQAVVEWRCCLSASRTNRMKSSAVLIYWGSRPWADAQPGESVWNSWSLIMFPLLSVSGFSAMIILSVWPDIPEYIPAPTATHRSSTALMTYTRSLTFQEDRPKDNRLFIPERNDRETSRRTWRCSVGCNGSFDRFATVLHWRDLFYFLSEKGSWLKSLLKITSLIQKWFIGVGNKSVSGDLQQSAISARAEVTATKTNSPNKE